MDLSIKNSNLKDIWKSSTLTDGNAAYLEQLYEDYLQNPSTVSDEWRGFFDQLGPLPGDHIEQSHEAVQQFFCQLTKNKQNPNPVQSTPINDEKQVRVLQLINAYRFIGHLRARTDPLEQKKPKDLVELTLAHYQLGNQDLNTIFNTGSLHGTDTARLADIINILERTYCGYLGAEYMHILNIEEKRWLQQKLETLCSSPDYSDEIKKSLLKQLIAAENLEQYLHTRYIGQKRFSLEGAESLILILKELIHRGGEHHSIKEVAIGMAHRGRLNVLVNIMGKTPAELFMEFEGTVENRVGTGDVKYHMGFSADLATKGNPVHASLAFNPSHLEIVAPVVEGSVRARQDRCHDKTGSEVIPIIIHGDAAFAAQGVVMETFSMSQSRGYSTKGTVHIVINNQIGFTSSTQEDARSTHYCTDVAKMVNAPIFHVNGDSPETVLMATQIALDYRMQFSKDIVIDLVCYRRHGHSEADEPMATQPMMYASIRKMETTLGRYTKLLIDQNIITEENVTVFAKEYRHKLDAGSTVVEEFICKKEADFPFLPDWEQYKKPYNFNRVNTALDKKTLASLHTQVSKLPDNFVVHRNVKRILDARKNMITQHERVDWGFAETMAYASLLNDGYSIRLSGQDSGRGTFFHRHAVLHDQNTGESYVPLRNLEVNDANFLVINSLLSEEAVLAFEYGYATTDPQTLTIWEAQFGDFANNAQVVIDQFISAGEQKWDRLCGLVMLLPHGFEGQGPEHSSARTERYLQLCAQHNMQVCVPTNAAQIFHLLRRQMLMKCRLPLIVMSPKSLLRHPAASSALSDLTEGEFRTIIPEQDELKDDDVKHIIFCSGKVYYDLYERRNQESLNDIAIIRIEQLYPFPEDLTRKQIKRYKNATAFTWCQEEPLNQGAWYSSQHHIREAIGKGKYLQYAGRPLLAAPAVGYMSIHNQQKQQLIEDALGLSTHCDYS
ncbi:MAG: 2-oxoglutarate dehydrogenase E1 component [Gammaproteobacteria bacterium]|nr:2-oxoglutarate dehydrogenase E1 component [Gammaproteobacteria bacterium]